MVLNVLYVKERKKGIYIPSFKNITQIMPNNNVCL